MVLFFQIADPYLFDNDRSEDERADTEEEEKALAARDTWSGIANSIGLHSFHIIRPLSVLFYFVPQEKNLTVKLARLHIIMKGKIFI